MRRLIFGVNTNVVQTEVRLKAESKSKKAEKKKKAKAKARADASGAEEVAVVASGVIDYSYLCFDYHRYDELPHFFCVPKTNSPTFLTLFYAAQHCHTHSAIPVRFWQGWPTSAPCLKGESRRC